MNIDIARRLKTFAIEIIALISKGKKESLEVIYNKIDEGNTIQYLHEKYKNEMSYPLNEEVYSFNEYEKAFTDVANIVNRKAENEFGIIGNDDGLLFITAILISAFVE